MKIVKIASDYLEFFQVAVPGQELAQGGDVCPALSYDRSPVL